MNSNNKFLNPKLGKASLLIIFAILNISLLFNSCDDISQPYLKQSTPKPQDTTVIHRKVLLEDYTGYSCVNCPDAAVIAEQLKGIFGSRLIVLDVHAGWFATPKDSSAPKFLTNEGTELDNFFQISQVGNPKGMVNRILFNNNRILERGDWEADINSIYNDTAIVKINLSASYNLSNRTISTDIGLKYLQNSSNNDYLCVYIDEDSILGKQEYPTGWDTNYVFNHVLRGSFSGTWGELLNSNTISAGDSISKHYEFTIPAGKNWRTESLKIVAFVYNHTSYEILQAEETNLK